MQHPWDKYETTPAATALKLNDCIHIHKIHATNVLHYRNFKVWRDFFFYPCIYPIHLGKRLNRIPNRCISKRHWNIDVFAHGEVWIRPGKKCLIWATVEHQKLKHGCLHSNTDRNQVSVNAGKPFLFSCHVQSQTAGASWEQLQALSCSRLFTCMWLWRTQLCLRGKSIYTLQQISPLNAHARYFSPYFFFVPFLDRWSVSKTRGTGTVSGHVIVLNNERGDQSSAVSCCADIYVGAAGQQFITAHGRTSKKKKGSAWPYD